MPRASQSVSDLPFQTWTVKVEEQNRVRVPNEILQFITWLDSNGGIECVALPGSSGGIQLTPWATYREGASPFIQALTGTPSSASESSEKWIDAVRYLATFWRISISIEASRISFTLPEALRRAEQLPAAGGSVVVFASGEILEIWPAHEWFDHVRKTATSKVAAIAAALEDLEQR